MRYVRFALATKHPESGVYAGLFELAYSLRDDVNVDALDRKQLAESLSWFEKHLRTPARFNRTRSKGYYRRATRGIVWFRDSAAEHIAQMHRIAAGA